MNLARPLDGRASGFLLHITPLPDLHGIGDFGPAAFRFVDWLERAGQQRWQLLSMTPIGPGHSPHQSVSAFAGWCAAQADWRADDALFMALEAAHGGAPWWHWGAALAGRDALALDSARKAQTGEIAFWQLVQGCFDTPWAAVKTYANQRGIALMGGLPIFIAHHSADCCARPDLYSLDEDFQPMVVVGCPPDAYRGWVERTQRALAQVDVFRIDHFCGFLSCWEVPAASPTAVDGIWQPGPGQALFDAIAVALGALPIVAEDLGEMGHAVYLDCDASADGDEVTWAMTRALRVSTADLGIFQLQDVLGQGGDARMNLPGSMNDASGAWRFTAPLQAAVTGRAPLARLATEPGAASELRPQH